MALTTDQYQQLMRFLDADMSTEEMAAFEKELDANPELRQQLDFELRVAGGLAGKEEDVSLAGKGKLIPLTNNRWKYWIAAASIVVVAVSAYLLLRRPAIDQSLVDNPDSTQVHDKDSLAITPTPAITHHAPAPDSLFKQYYKAPAIPDSLPMILADALYAFEKRDYAPIEAFDIDHLPTLRGLEEENKKTQVVAMFYKGIAALQQQKTDSAIRWFNRIIKQHPGNRWVSNAQWYLAMAYLRKEDVKAATAVLNTLKEDRTYGPKATQLLNALQQPE